MITVPVITKLTEDGMWQCRTRIPTIGIVVIGQGRTEYQAQYVAAKFLDTNYPGYLVNWVGGYHGGDTSPRSYVTASQYWGE